MPSTPRAVALLDHAQQLAAAEEAAGREVMMIQVTCYASLGLYEKKYQVAGMKQNMVLETAYMVKYVRQAPTNTTCHSSIAHMGVSHTHGEWAAALER